MSSLLQDLSSAVAGPLGQLRNALGEVERLGGAGRLAGDPAALRRAAWAWREQAAATRELQSELDLEVRRTLEQGWQGQASQAFAANWRSLSGKLLELAAGYERMAAGLERSAARTGGLNTLAAELVVEIEGLVAALEGVQDAAAVAGLAGQAGVLAARWGELLREVEAAWAEFLSWALAMTLWFQHLLRTLPGAQPLAVPRPGWGIDARLGPGGAVIELRPAAGADGGAGSAGLRRGPPADAGSLWRWLLVWLAVLAGHDAGVLARLIARASGENEPESSNSSKNPADGEPAFGGPPQLGPPTEPPRNDKGGIDWEAWETRLRQKGVTGDLAERLANARADRAGAFEELRAAERLADAGYQVEFIEPVANLGQRNPDISIVGGREVAAQTVVRVEVKSGNLIRGDLNSNIDKANDQIKFAEGASDPQTVARQQGYILYDSSRASTTQLDQKGVESYLRGKMTEVRLRRIRYLEVLYNDRGVLKRTYMVRNPEGSIAGPVTDVFSAAEPSA